MAEPTFDADARHPVAGGDYPSDLAQLRAWFPSDAACLDYLDWLRWPEGFRCPRCGHDVAGREATGRYRCRQCRMQVAVTAGTIFHKTRTPLTVWFEAAWLMTADKGGVSAAHLQRVLPISSYQTAWAMLSRYRQVMSPAGSEPLRGTVEVDETFLGGPRPGKAGRGALGKTLVAGAIEILPDGWGRARLSVILDASAPSLRAFITTNIAPGTTVITDGWASYPAALEGYEHDRRNVTASGQPAHESLPAVHRLFALVKRTIDGTYQGAAGTDHLTEYLDEFVFRFNCRHSHHRGLVFMRLLQRAVGGDPITYRALVRDSTPKTVKPSGRTGTRRQPGTLEITPAMHPWREPH